MIGLPISIAEVESNSADRIGTSRESMNPFSMSFTFLSSKPRESKNSSKNAVTHLPPMGEVPV